MHKNFLIALWKFTRDGKKTEKALFKSLKVSKTFIVKSLTRSKLDVPPKKTTYKLFYKVMWEKKKSWRLPLFPSQALSYWRNARRLKLMTRIWRSTLTLQGRKTTIWKQFGEIPRRSFDKVEIISLNKKLKKDWHKGRCKGRHKMRCKGT